MCEQRIKNEVIGQKVEIAPIEDKMRETRLRWFGHVKRRNDNTPVRRCEMISLLECRRGRGRPKKSWKKVIKEDLNLLGLTEDMTQDIICGDLGLRLQIIDSVSLVPHLAFIQVGSV